MKYPIILPLLMIMLFATSCKKDEADTIENCLLKSVEHSGNLPFSAVRDIEYNDEGQIIAFSTSAIIYRNEVNYLYTDNENESILEDGLDFNNNSILTTNYIYHNNLLIEKSRFDSQLGLRSCDLETYRYDDQNRLVFYQFLKASEFSVIFPEGNNAEVSQFISREKRFEYIGETELVVENKYLESPYYPYSHTETYSKNQGEANWTQCNLKLNRHDAEGNIISTSERIFNFEYDNYPVVGFDELEPGSSLNAAFNNANNLIKVSGDNVAYELSIVNDDFRCESIIDSCQTDNYEISIQYIFDENDKLIEYRYNGYSGNDSSSKFEYECD